jgi:16S rRNA (cytosine1402-N4)-methyltransferase
MHSHQPVMLAETLTGLNVHAGGIYVDCTFGRGGHATAILDVLAGSGRVVALDQDPEAVAHGETLQKLHGNFTIVRVNFAKLSDVAAQAAIAGKVDGVLMDLGVSSPQLDDARRGFSFSTSGPLDMRMDPLSGQSAAQWLMRAEQDEIADVLYRFGEERNSRRIARRIVDTRASAPLETTAQLAELIAGVPGPRSRKIHPATRSFQAIRIFINRELEVLPLALAQAVEVLAPGGRLAVISFHSLEDRIVKRFVRDSGPGTRDSGQDASFRVPGPESRVPSLRTIGRYFPTDAECAANPRARSAVLRVAEKVQ